MEPGIVIVIAAIGGTLALIATIVVATQRWEKRRVEELRTVAGAMGFTFHEPAGGDTLAPWVGALPLFDRGHSRRALAALEGAIAGTPVVLADYRYVTGSGKNQQTHTQTVAVFTELGRGLPEFELCPEHIFHKIGQVFGYQDLDFEGYEEFSKHYLLRGKDESAVRGVFGPETLSLLGGDPGWTVQACDGRLAVFRARKRVKPPVLPAFLADALRIAGAISRRGAS
jgi:hypothetical protein